MGRGTIRSAGAGSLSGPLVWLLFLAVIQAACQSYGVRSDWDDSVAFDRLRSYYWQEPAKAPNADPFADNSLLRKRVRTAIEANLAERGLRPVSSREDADFLVTYGVQLDQKTQVSGTTGVGAYGGYGGFGRWPFGVGTGIGTTDVRNYQEAILIVDFLDPKSENLIWRGWGSGFLQTRDRDRGQKRFEAGVEAVLDRFPPRAARR